MQCDWCYYELANISRNFPGYDIFNAYGNALGYTMCSINCCVAQIYKLGLQVEPRLEYLYDHYGINCPVRAAPDPNKLTLNGGSLSYAQYRQNFVCPPIYEEQDVDEDDYEFDDGDPYR